MKRRAGQRKSWLSPCEVADFLGVHVSTVYRYIREGALPHRRLPGGHLRIPPEDLEDLGIPADVQTRSNVSNC